MGSITAGLYARVSTDSQARGNTIASQLAALHERACADAVRIDPHHAYVDEGRSGATLARPALERLRDAVAGGEIDRIYVHAPDRLARRYAYQVLLMEEFRRAGAEIVFLNRPIGGSAEDDLLLQVQGVIAEYERARILERSRRGRRHAARSGAVSAMCSAPFGYRYVDRHAGGGAAQFEVIEYEAQMVRQVFTWIGIERISLREACRRLQNMGRVTRTGLEHWDATTLNGMLRNPAYRGAAMFGRTRSIPPVGVRLRPIRGRTQPPRDGYGSHAAVPCDEWISIPVPAIVDPDMFKTVQEQLDENRKRKRDGRRRPGWLLQGLVVCRQCGDGLDQLDWHGRRDIIRALVRRIEIDHDKVEVVFRIPRAPTSPDGGGIDGSDRSQDGLSQDIRQHCGASHGRFVGEDPDDVAAALDLVVQPLDRRETWLLLMPSIPSALTRLPTERVEMP